MRVRGGILSVVGVCATTWLAAASLNGDEGDRALEEARARMAHHGVDHQWLSQLLGRWEAVGDVFADGEVRGRLQGTIEGTSVLDGRFVRFDVALDGVVDDYRALEYVGYDDTAGLYEGASMTNRDTQQYHYEGKRVGEVLTMDAVVIRRAGRLPFRRVLTRRAADELVIESFSETEGTLRKISELRLSRIN